MNEEIDCWVCKHRGTKTCDYCINNPDHDDHFEKKED